jgi:hypothetical protein
VNEIGHDGHWVPRLGKNESTFPPPGWKALEELPQEPVELIRHLARRPGGVGPKPLRGGQPARTREPSRRVAGDASERAASGGKFRPEIAPPRSRRRRLGHVHANI